MILNGCGLEKPESPRWTVDLLVPIASRHVDGPYLAAHAGSDYLRWSDDSGLAWNIVASLDTVRVTDNLTTQPTNSSGNYSLGTVSVARGSEMTCEIALTDVAPLAAGAVPDMSTSVDADFPAAVAFDSLSGASAQMHLVIENELGVSIDNVTVTLFGHSAAPLAQIPVAGTITPGESRSAEYTLSNLTVGDDWTATIAFHTPGGTVLSAADKYLAVRASFPEGISATYARGVIDATSRTFSDSLILSSSHALTSAQIAQGLLQLYWTNNTPLPVTVEWSVPGIELAGNPLGGNIQFAPGASSSMSITLDGAEFIAGQTPSSADVEVAVSSIGSGGQTIEISGAQTVGYSLTWSDLVLSSATGRIASTQISTGELATSLNWDAGLDAAGVDSCDAVLVLSSTLPLSGQVSGLVTTNTGLHLPFSGIMPAGGEVPSFARITLANGLLLHPLPSSVSLSGSIAIGGGAQSVTITATDFVAAAVELNAPAHMYVDDVSINTGPTSISLSGEDYGDRTGRLVHATVTINFTNRFPLGGQFTLRIAPDSATLLTTDAIVLGPSTLNPAVTDANGYSAAPSTTVLTYALDSAELRVFEREVVWFSESMTLLGPGNNQPARISSSDVLDWHAQARLEMKLDSDVRPWED